MRKMTLLLFGESEYNELLRQAVAVLPGDDLLSDAERIA